MVSLFIESLKNSGEEFVDQRFDYVLNHVFLFVVNDLVYLFINNILPFLSLPVLHHNHHDLSRVIFPLLILLDGFIEMFGATLVADNNHTIHMVCSLESRAWTRECSIWKLMESCVDVFSWQGYIQKLNFYLCEPFVKDGQVELLFGGSGIECKADGDVEEVREKFV